MQSYSLEGVSLRSDCRRFPSPSTRAGLLAFTFNSSFTTLITPDRLATQDLGCDCSGVEQPASLSMLSFRFLLGRAPAASDPAGQRLRELNQSGVEAFKARI